MAASLTRAMNETIERQAIERAATALARARSITVLTGAGISAESGIPTFRDALTGLWSKHRPEDLATPEAFLRDPKTVWEWYAWRREKVRAVEPNAIEAAIAAVERSTRQPLERRDTLRLELEQAQYQARLAARRYEAVDPDNRLVCAELEARWNAALQRAVAKKRHQEARQANNSG